MNTAEKMTHKANELNRKANRLNNKISPMPIPKIPEIKVPTRESQRIGAAVTGVASLGALAISGLIFKSKIGMLGGIIGLVGASISYLDSIKK